MSKLLLPLTSVRYKSPAYVSPRFYASMGNEIFAVIGLRLSSFVFEKISYFNFDASHTTFEFLYVTGALAWEAIPFVAVWLPGHGIVMRVSGGPMPLSSGTHSRRHQHILVSGWLLKNCQPSCKEQIKILKTSMHTHVVLSL